MPISQRIKLTKTSKRLVKKASREGVRLNMTGLKRHFDKHRWVGKTNRYANDCIKKIHIDTQNNCVQPSFNELHLTQYIAASSVIHSVDAWSYLGRAIHCHIHGDPSTASHLAYYAELRAIMSLLATEGIGIFNNKHFIIKKDGLTEMIYQAQRGQRLNTHAAASLVFENWADHRESFDLLINIISIGGISLDEWVTGFSDSNKPFKPIGKSWFINWGIDIKKIENDRDARNTLSYRPTYIPERETYDSKKLISDIVGIWELCEPDSYLRFGNLDKHLLRVALEKVYKSSTGKDPFSSSARANYESKIIRTLNLLGPRLPAIDQWKNFLLRRTEPENPKILRDSITTTSFNNASHHIQVMARALLLLRITSGACAKLLDDSGIDRNDLSFWTSQFGVDRGIWSKENEPPDFTDLWADIDDALAIVTSNINTNISIKDLINTHSHHLSVLGQTERAALWTIGL